MFKFGKYAIPQGPYQKFQEPLSFVSSAVNKGAVATLSKTRIQANCGSGTSSGSGSSGDLNSSFGSSGASINRGSGGYNADRYNPVFDNLEEGTILEDWIPRDAAGLDLLYRRIYLRDPTLGPGIDIIRSLPWSDFTLEGIDDTEIKKIYEECMSSLNPLLLMPDLTHEFLTLGRSISSLIFDQRRGIFSGVVPHDPDFVRVTPLPVYGHDPLCDFTLSPGFKKFLQNPDPRAVDARKSLPPAFLDAAAKQQGFLPLDPLSTIYLARKTAPNDSVGTSILTRSLYFWAIEKALLNAQLSSTRRRARSFIHLKAGIDNLWEPSPEEIDALAGIVIQANEDPVGGVIATRTGVDISEPVGGGADFYKWSDELELFAKYKMQSIGISDALLSGDGTYNNSEQARSVFVENLATLRSRIVNKFFMQKLFPVVARVHGFIKRTPAELSHRIRTTPVGGSKYPSWAQATTVTSQKLSQRESMAISTENLVVPTINWAKQLKPTQDEKALEILERLKQNEYPVTLSQWANAAGFNPKTIEQEQKDDIELQARVNKLKESIVPPEEAAPEGEGEGGEGSEEDLGIEIPEASEAQPSGEEEPVQQSVYSRAKRIARGGPVARVEHVAIWHNGKCGGLSRGEAKQLTGSLLKDHSTEIFKDPRALMGKIHDKLGGEKAPIMAYVLNRLGLAAFQIDEKAAQMIASSARNGLNRHGSFQSEKALLDVRRYETEIQALSSYVNGKSGLTKSQIKNKLVNPGPMGSSVMGGIS